MNIKWFRRSDGVPFSTVEGSATDELMTRDGSFTPCDETGKDLPAETTDESSDESKTDADKSTLEDGKPAKDPGQGSAGKRGGARGRNKKDYAIVDAKGSAGGKDVPKGSDNGTGDTKEPASESETSKGKSE